MKPLFGSPQSEGRTDSERRPRSRPRASFAVSPAGTSDAAPVPRPLARRTAAPGATPCVCVRLRRFGGDVDGAERSRTLDARDARAGRRWSGHGRQPRRRRWHHLVGPHRAGSRQGRQRAANAARPAREIVAEPSDVGRAGLCRRHRARQRPSSLSLPVWLAGGRERLGVEHVHGRRVAEVLGVRSGARRRYRRGSRPSTGRACRVGIHREPAVLLARTGSRTRRLPLRSARERTGGSVNATTIPAEAFDNAAADEIRVFDSAASPADPVALHALRLAADSADLAAPAVVLPDFHFKADKEMPSSIAVATRETIRPTCTCYALTCGMPLVALDLERPRREASADIYAQARARLPFPPTYRRDLSPDDVLPGAAAGAA